MFFSRKYIYKLFEDIHEFTELGQEDYAQELVRMQKSDNLEYGVGAGEKQRRNVEEKGGEVGERDSV